MSMKRITAWMIVLLLIGTCALAEPATLTVQGIGTVRMAPDSAVITFGVKRTSKDISQAQADVNGTLGQVIDRLKEMGVTEDDIETSSISIYEDYSYRDYSSLPSDDDTMYAVENSVSVTVRDIEHAGSYIDAVFEAGANSFSGIYFRASDSSQERERAMVLAVENAMDRAKVLAEAAGMKLGGIVSITDGGSGGYFSIEEGAYEKAVASDAGAGFANMVFTSDLQVSASVSVVFALEDNH